MTTETETKLTAKQIKEAKALGEKIANDAIAASGVANIIDNVNQKSTDSVDASVTTTESPIQGDKADEPTKVAVRYTDTNCVSEWVTLIEEVYSEDSRKVTKALDLKVGVLVHVIVEHEGGVSSTLQYCQGVKFSSLLKNV